MNYHRYQFNSGRSRPGANGRDKPGVKKTNSSGYVAPLNRDRLNQNINSASGSSGNPHDSRYGIRPLPPIGATSGRRSGILTSGPMGSFLSSYMPMSRREQTIQNLIKNFQCYTMGQTLSEPVTTKVTSKGENSFVKVGSSCMQGWRINMEDAHTHLLSLPGDKDACFFGVFDGHGGVKVAQYAGNNLHNKILSQPAYQKGNIGEAIRNGFLAIDEEMIRDENMKEELAGTTAVVVLMKNGKLYCGNVGDSRAVASVHGEVEQLSFDHKPSNEAETKRIIAAGGWVELNRVNGNLALSRALGDFVFKKNDKKRAEEQIVTANPDVIEKPITESHEFVLLACDGIWDVLTNQEVVDFVRNRIAQRMEPDMICEELMTRCLAPDCQAGGLGCDNMTVVLVCFKHGGTYEDLVRECAKPSRGGLVPHLNDYSSRFEFK